MIDLNALISSALAAAVAEAVKPLAARVAELEAIQARAVNPATVAEQGGQLAGLAEHLGDRLGTVLARLDTLEARPAAAVDALTSDAVSALVTHLDNQEWFWEKLMRKAGEAAESAVEEAMNDHCTTYDHDDYDNVSSTVNDVDLDNIVTEDNLRDEIRRALRDATVSIDI